MSPPTIDELLRSLPAPEGPDPSFEAGVRQRLAEELAAARGDAPSPGDRDADLRTADLIDLPPKAQPAPRRRLATWALGVAAALVVAALVAVTVVVTDGSSDLAVGDGTVVFDDGFDDASGGWIDHTTAGMSVVTGGGRQAWQFTAPGISGIEEPKSVREQLADVQVTADVIAVSPGTTLGLWCRKVRAYVEGEAYVFRLGSGGASITAPSAVGPAQVIAAAPDVEVPSEPFAMTARCRDDGDVARLQLLVDGDEVLAATHDRPLAPGVVAVSGAADLTDGGPREIVLDRFVVTHLG